MYTILAGCRDSNPRCCDRSEVGYHWATVHTSLGGSTVFFFVHRAVWCCVLAADRLCRRSDLRPHHLLLRVAQPCRIQHEGTVSMEVWWSIAFRSPPLPSSSSSGSSRSHHTKPPRSQIGCSSKNFSSNHHCCLTTSAAFKYVPQTTATTFAFSSA